MRAHTRKETRIYLDYYFMAVMAVNPLVEALVRWLPPAEHRRLSLLSRAWHREANQRVPRYEAPRAPFLALLRRMTCMFSCRTYWSCLQAATSCDAATLQRLGALFWVVEFHESAVRPTLSVGDHFAVIVDRCRTYISAAAAAGPPPTPGHPRVPVVVTPLALSRLPLCSSSS